MRKPSVRKENLMVASSTSETRHDVSATEVTGEERIASQIDLIRVTADEAEAQRRAW
jgi:hypothetical protein